jgi:glutaminyl-tRNA synthetase
VTSTNVNQLATAPVNGEAPSRPSDFIHDIIDEHLRAGRYQGIVTRFPPEPNGYLHIGHAKSICLNFGLANDYGGVCHLRMDDTDPTKESVEYVESIMNDVRWLGFDWQGKMFYASDYFEKLYRFAVKLLQEGKAYVDSLNEEEIRKYRGTVTEAGKPSPFRNRSVEENLDLFERMRRGEFADGAHVVRARIDMANPNMKMRDPLLYRIRKAHHYRTADDWCIYPMYDFAHPLSDAMEGITHSICTLEFENNRELYDWMLEACGFSEPRPHQYEFARLNLNYTVMSKRKLLQLVEEKHVSGWDDPRLPTISGLRRRGYTAEAIRNFCRAIGVAKANSTVDMAQLEHAIRDDLNQKVPRVLCVLRPLKVVITNYPEGQTEELDAPYYPHDVPKEGSRKLPFSREIVIERDDFMENPPKGYYRLSPGAEVRLRHGYIIKCDDVIKDTAGNVVELHCSYDPLTRSGAPNAVDRKVKGTIHWISVQHGGPVEVRLYDRLYTLENPEGITDLNPESLEVLSGSVAEPSLAMAEAGSRFQFERQGYFCADAVDSKPGKPVFNRIVTLKDTWARMNEGSPKTAATETKPAPKQPVPPAPPKGRKPEARELTPEQEATAKRLREAYQLSGEDAVLLAESQPLTQFFEEAVKTHANPAGIANWIVNELLRELKEREISALSFGPKELAELVSLIDDETISGKIAKDVFAEILKSGGSPKAIVEQKGWKQISDPKQLMPIIDRVVAASPENVARFKEGKGNVFGFFVGQVLKETGGKANPRLVNELLQQRLSQ